MSTPQTESPLDTALRHFATAEANLDKLDRHLQRLIQPVPEGICFGSNAEYDDACRGYSELLAGLPKIDGWTPSATPWIWIPLPVSVLMSRKSASRKCSFRWARKWRSQRELVEYRYRLNRARRRFIRESILRIAEQLNAICGKHLALISWSSRQLVDLPQTRLTSLRNIMPPTEL